MTARPPSVPPSSSTPALLRRGFLFHEYELELETGRLRRHGRPVEIQAQPRKLLTLLVAAARSRPGEVVTHEEIRECLWGDSHVDAEQGIRFAIRQVRRTLDDDAARPRFVATEVGQGYRFIAPVQDFAADSIGQARDMDRKPSQRLQLLLVPAMLALVALLTGTTAWILPRASSLILIEPFDNPGATSVAKEQGALLAKEVGIALGRLLQNEANPFAPGSARLLDRSKYGPEDLSPDFRLEGAIQRSDSGLRVTARLVHSRTRAQLWSTAYEHRERGDLPEVARWIAEAVSFHFTGTRPRAAFPARKAPDPEVARLYERARRLIDENLLVYSPKAENAVLEAHGLLTRALKIDPAFPPLHLELARIHVWRGDRRHGSAPRASRAREAKDRPAIPNEGLARRHLHSALVLDQHLETAWALYGMQALFRDLDLVAAEVAIERALELDPSLSCAHYLRGTARTVAGHHEEAAESLLRALALAPQDTELHVAVGRQLFVMRRFDEARRVFREVDELLRKQGRDHIVCLTCLGLLVRIELIEGKPAGTALAHARREMARMRAMGEKAPILDPSHPRESLRRYWRWWLRELPQDAALVERAALQLALGERREALVSLRRVPLHREDLTRIYLRWDPRFDGLRQEPEFAEIVEAVFERRQDPGAGPLADFDPLRGEGRARSSGIGPL